MQTTYGLQTHQIIPARGLLFCEPLLGQYETESGILVVKDMKRNPKIDKMRVIRVGGPFTIHARVDCEICGTDGRCKKKEIPGTYWAGPGDIIWTKRGFKKMDVQGKTHCFVKNSSIVAISRDANFRAPGDMVLVDPVYDGMVAGSKIIMLHDRDKEYIGNYHGVVVAVGQERKDRLKPGDKIHFRRHEGVKVEYEGKKLLSLKSKWVDCLSSD